MAFPRQMREGRLELCGCFSAALFCPHVQVVAKIQTFQNCLAQRDGSENTDVAANGLTKLEITGLFLTLT